MNIGSSNRTLYDQCDYQRYVHESTSPLAFNTDFTKYEHRDRCVIGKLHTRFDVVDIESELRNQTRPLSNCDRFKYSPGCKSKSCFSTFDEDMPVVLAPDVCPIIFNNIPKDIGPGFVVDSRRPCTKGRKIKREVFN